jgi:Fic family protein
MKPPYDITPRILTLISSIGENIGRVDASFLDKPSPRLRKQNRIKTIHSTLTIEGNRLSENQVTAIIENKRVAGPEKDVLEVLNAMKVYDQLHIYIAESEKSFLSAHKKLMTGLIKNPGTYRNREVGIIKGAHVKHLAPPPGNINYLMKELFRFLKSSSHPLIIKACIFHYEVEFIHPFIDGNGRMGRLWQTLILAKKYPVFEYLPLETLISKDQKKYYAALSLSDKQGKSTIFIEYMLSIIDRSLQQLLDQKGKRMTDLDRIAYYLENGPLSFTRKDYMYKFKNISSATASRDLSKAVEMGIIKKKGEKNKTIYTRKKQ